MNHLTNAIIILLLIGITLNACKKEEVPTLRTSEISNITGNTASSGGTITNEGSGTVTSRGVCWSTVTTPTIADKKTSEGAGTGTFISNIIGLNKGTIYYVRAFATNNAGTGYGNEIKFTTNNASIIKYTMEIDNTYRIYRVSESNSESTESSIVEYFYSPDSIIRKTSVYGGEDSEHSMTIYYINISGLCDSSQYSWYFEGKLQGTLMSYYFYNSNNYLTMMIKRRSDYAGAPQDTTFYAYNNGNLIKSNSNGIPGIYTPFCNVYTHNSKKNFIDIESFGGTFLGTLNQNLMESVNSVYPSQDNLCFRYQYILNPKGLVEERTTLPCSDQLDEISIEKYEYIIDH